MRRGMILDWKRVLRGAGGTRHLGGHQPAGKALRRVKARTGTHLMTDGGLGTSRVPAPDSSGRQYVRRLGGV